MDSQENDDSIKEKEESVISDMPADENNFVNPDKLRKEIKRIIGNMTESKDPSEREDKSLIEECISEVKSKEKFENHKRDHKKKRKGDSSSSSDGKIDSLDSTRTDVGIPPIPVCDPSKPVQGLKASTLVLDPASKRKVYVPGKEKSDFFRCPHKRIEYTERNLSFPPSHDHRKTSQIMEKQVDRYHYNHFVLRNNEINQVKKEVPDELTTIDKSIPSGRLTLFKRLKSACLRGKDEQIITEAQPPNVESITIEPDDFENDPICYCGTGNVNENHVGDDYSSAESIDQIYKVKVDSTTCPKSFIFRAIDKEAMKRHGEVHFVVDNRQMREDPILENIKLSKEQSSMLIPQANQAVLSSQPSPIEKEDKSLQIDRIESEASQQKQLSFKGSVHEYYGKQYKPVRTKPERIDIYMFDHQDTRYFHTTDNPPPVLTEVAVHKVENVATKFWAEIFSVLHVVFAFLTSFILQSLKFLLLAIGRPLTTGVIQIFSDYFLKPLLTITFNGIVQPPIIFVYNIMTSFRDLCRPLASGLGYFVKELAQFVSAIRLCKVINTTNNGPFVAHPIPHKV